MTFCYDSDSCPLRGHFKVITRSSQGQGNVKKCSNEKGLSGGNRALIGGSKTLFCVILQDLQCPNWLGGRMSILYGHSCAAKKRTSSVLQFVKTDFIHSLYFLCACYLFPPRHFPEI